jgi:hypothetical protein
MYARALDELKAQRSLDHINEMMAVWGEDSPDRTQYLDALKTAANGGRQSFVRASEEMVVDGAIPFGGFRIPVETVE